MGGSPPRRGSPSRFQGVPGEGAHRQNYAPLRKNRRNSHDTLALGPPIFIRRVRTTHGAYKNEDRQVLVLKGPAAKKYAQRVLFQEAARTAPPCCRAAQKPVAPRVRALG